MDYIALQDSLIKEINEASPEGILVVNEQGIVVSHNQRFVEIWDIPAERLRGSIAGTAIGDSNQLLLTTVLERVKDPEGFLARVRELYADPELIDHSEIQLRDGRTVVRHSRALHNNEGSFLGRASFFRDITEHKQTEEQLLITQFVSDYAPESIFWIDEQARIAYINEAGWRERGYSKEELLTMSIPDIDPDFTFEVWPGHWQELQQHRHLSFETRHRRKDGTIYPVEVSANLIEFNGKAFNIAFIRDISERKAAEEQIRNLAFHDPLTQLPNRRLLTDRLQHALSSSARSGQQGALLFIDLDHFKTLNDTLGHDIGDLLLQQVAHRLESSVRAGDTVARLGGDEFVLILEGLSEDAIDATTQAEAICDKILAALRRPYQLGVHNYHNTPSIGAVLFNGDQVTTDELMKQADIAMYQSKKGGRDSLRFFDPAIHLARE